MLSSVVPENMLAIDMVYNEEHAKAKNTFSKIHRKWRRDSLKTKHVSRSTARIHIQTHGG